MSSLEQREQNPDVNSYNPDADPGEDSGTSNDSEESNDIERPGGDGSVPLPPDTMPSAPVEEPPGSDGPPVGDVDDSPKRIA